VCLVLCVLAATARGGGGGGWEDCVDVITGTVGEISMDS
jgi:hypothetical protein